jgi:hypothetical protein
MDFAEQDVNGGVHNSKKSLALAVSEGDNNSITSGGNRGQGGDGKTGYTEAREAREVSSSERHTRRYRRKPTSIMLEGMPDDQDQTGVLGTGSFSSISDAGTSILSGRKLDEAFGRVAPPTRSTDDLSTGSFFSNDDATDYAICRAMIPPQYHDESRDDPQAESRDDAWSG